MTQSHRFLFAVAALALIPLQGVSAADGPAGSVFKCDGGREMVAQFSTKGSQAIAVVDVGDGAHELTLLPWRGGAPQVMWGDGRRTLTWTPGVQLMWMDGSTHLMCGRGGHSH